MGVDRAQQREQLRRALGALGADLTLFEDVALDKLWDNWYRSVRALEDATRDGLKDAGCPPGIIDHILALKGSRLAAAGCWLTRWRFPNPTTRQCLCRSTNFRLPPRRSNYASPVWPRQCSSRLPCQFLGVTEQPCCTPVQPLPSSQLESITGGRAAPAAGVGVESVTGAGSLLAAAGATTSQKSEGVKGTGLLEGSAPTIAWKGEDRGGRGQVWEITYPDGSRRLYLDACGAVTRRIKNWVKSRCKIAGAYHKSNVIAALVVSGLIKTGKTYTVSDVLPALLAGALSTLRPEHPLKGMVVLRLNCFNLRRQEGGSSLLYSFVESLVEWVGRTGVPVEPAAWNMAQRVLAKSRIDPNLCTLATNAIVELFAGFQAPVLVLLDELQALLQPTDVWGELDLSSAIFIRDVLLRRLLLESPPTVLWAVTGSSMALVWMALAAMPVNGAAPLLRIVPVHLPSAVPPSLMQELVDDSLLRHGLPADIMQQLLMGSGGSPALFTEMVETWCSTSEETDTEVGEFIATFMRSKMLEEVQKEWALSLAHMTDVQRSGIRDLAYNTTGAQIEAIGRGIQLFLEPHLQQTPGGRYFLKDSFQRQLLRAAINRGGKLHSNRLSLGPGLTMALVDWGWHLIQLGEVADYLLGLRGSSDEDIPTDGADKLQHMLQDLADRAVVRLPVGDSSVAGRWEAYGPFTQVLNSKYNDGSRTWYRGEGKFKKLNIKGKDKLKSDLAFLVFFLRLSRNVLAHQKPWDGPDPAGEEVVMALPKLVDMGAEELADKAREGMSALAQTTITAAEEHAAADGAGRQSDSGGSGSTVVRAAVCGPGPGTGGSLRSCAGMSHATTLNSAAGAFLRKAERSWLGRLGPRRTVLPAPARIRSMQMKPLPLVPI